MTEQKEEKQGKIKKVLTSGLTQFGVNAAVAAAVVTYCLNYVEKQHEEIGRINKDLATIKAKIEKDKEQDRQIVELTQNSNEIQGITQQIPGTIGAQWNVIRGQQEVVNRIEVLALSNERLLDRVLSLKTRQLVGTTKEKRPDLLTRLKQAITDKPANKPVVIERVPETKEFRKVKEDEYMMQQTQEQLQMSK